MASYEELNDIEKGAVREHAWVQRLIRKLDKASARKDMKEVNHKVEAREKYKLSVLAGKTPEQIDTYIEKNITDLKSVREFLKKLSRILLVLAKSELGV